MARPLRIEFAGALHHVTARGNRRESIFLSETDRLAFHSLLGEVCDRFNWSVHAWCQMGNHYHLLLENPDGNLSAGMRQLNGVAAIQRQEPQRRTPSAGEVSRD